MTKTVAVLGLGAMGSRMAQRLLDAGVSVRVYNRTPQRLEALVARGAEGFAVPREAAEGADIVICMVRDDEASAQAWSHPKTGALLGMRPGAVAISCSTLSPAGIRSLAQDSAARDVQLLDAPVVGTRPQAEGGTLVFLVGGEASALEQVGPVLEQLGASVHHLGSVGRGTAMKLAVNALFGIQVAALAELLASLQGAGIEPARSMEVLGSLPVCSPAAKGTGGLMVAGRFAPMFPLELVAKDFGYALQLAAGAGSSAPVSAAAGEVFAAAEAAGFGHENLVAVVKLYRDLTPRPTPGEGRTPSDPGVR